MTGHEFPRDLSDLVDRVFDKFYRPDLLLKEELSDSELDELIQIAKDGRLDAFDAAGIIRLGIAKRIASGAPLSPTVRATILAGFNSLATQQQRASFFLPDIETPKPARGRPKGTGRTPDLFRALVAYGAATKKLRPSQRPKRGESPQDVIAHELGISKRELQRLAAAARRVIDAAKK